MTGRISAWAYAAGVLLVTGCGIAAAMALRPGFAATVRQVTGLEPARIAAPDSFYTVRVAPLFDRHCAGCHGARAAKGQLRLDSFAAVWRGGRHGDVLGKDGELYRRITLPQSDEKAMPPDGKPPLSKDELTVIRLWLADGARGDVPAATVKDAPRLVLPVTIPQMNPQDVARQRAPLADELARLQKRYPGLIAYESLASADLQVNAMLAGKRFGDADLQALLPLAARIVRLDLSGTAVTDAAPLSGLRAVTHLRLAGTGLTGAVAPALDGMAALKVLTVTGTNIAPESLAGLRRRGVTIHGEGDDGA